MRTFYAAIDEESKQVLFMQDSEDLSHLKRYFSKRGIQIRYIKQRPAQALTLKSLEKKYNITIESRKVPINKGHYWAFFVKGEPQQEPVIR